MVTIIKQQRRGAVWRSVPASCFVFFLVLCGVFSYGLETKAKNQTVTVSPNASPYHHGENVEEYDWYLKRKTHFGNLGGQSKRWKFTVVNRGYNVWTYPGTLSTTYSGQVYNATKKKYMNQVDGVVHVGDVLVINHGWGDLRWNATASGDGTPYLLNNKKGYWGGAIWKYLGRIHCPEFPVPNQDEYQFYYAGMVNYSGCKFIRKGEKGANNSDEAANACGNLESGRVLNVVSGQRGGVKVITRTVPAQEGKGYLWDESGQQFYYDAGVPEHWVYEQVHTSFKADCSFLRTSTILQLNANEERGYTFQYNNIGVGAWVDYPNVNYQTTGLVHLGGKRYRVTDNNAVSVKFVFGATYGHMVLARQSVHKRTFNNVWSVPSTSIDFNFRTGKFFCTGAKPKYTEPVGPEEEIGLTASIPWKHASAVVGNQKCEFKCQENYTWDSATSTCTPSCIGSIPKYAESVGPDEEAGLTVSVPWKHASAVVGNQKCEFKCQENYTWDSATSTCKQENVTADLKINGSDTNISIAEGSDADFTWNSTNADQCFIEGKTFIRTEDRGKQGKIRKKVGPGFATGKYILTCKNSATGREAKDTVGIDCVSDPTLGTWGNCASSSGSVVCSQDGTGERTRTNRNATCGYWTEESSCSLPKCKPDGFKETAP